MTFYNRYLYGETTQVYVDIQTLGEDAFLSHHFADIEKVLNETFERVAYNLDIIYNSLLAINYRFRTKTDFDFKKPLIKPYSNTDQLLREMDAVTRSFGYVPQSLKTFYKYVGGCNFGWDYETNKNILWKGADPLQIIPLPDLVSELKDNDSLIYMKEMFEDEDFATLPLSSDYLHKDNISGDMPYSLKISDKPAIDAPLLYEGHQTTFIDYLRICFEGGGFSKITEADNLNAYQAFLNNIKSKLKPI